MKVKTSELIGPALDWAVAKCEEEYGRDNANRFLRDHRIGFTTRYSANWSQGGPIVERELICVDPLLNGDWLAASRKQEGAAMLGGPTPLIAAMRCRVAMKLGDEVDVPDELLET